MSFVDRSDAGKQLAESLRGFRGSDVVVVGLPRGGIPVAYEIARGLEAPLDVIVVRKLGVPFQPELAMGALGEGGVRIVDRDLMHRAKVTRRQLAAVEEHELDELARRTSRFRRNRAPISLRGRTVIIVDDGLATGSTARAACQVARAQGATRVVVAVPVAPASTVDALRHEADEVVCLETPADFTAIGLAYDVFTQTSDAEVVELLERAARVSQ